MKITHKTLWAAVFGCALLGATETKAIHINITVPDYAGPHNGESANVWNGGTIGEDNETEQVGSKRALRGQRWDLEAFVVQGSKLVMIGGYDFQNGFGNPHEAPGDLFIKVGGPTPGYEPIAGSPEFVSNDSYYGYTYAVVLSGSLAGPSVPVVNLAGSTLQTVGNDFFRSNPWKYSSGGTEAGSVAINYRPGLTADQILADYQIALLGDGAGTYDGTPNYNLHNAVELDLSFLIDLGSVDLSYTMECGNDSIKGFNEGGFTLVPDAGMSIALLGMGLGGLALASRRRN